MIEVQSAEVMTGLIVIPAATAAAILGMFGRLSVKWGKTLAEAEGMRKDIDAAHKEIRLLKREIQRMKLDAKV